MLSGYADACRCVQLRGHFVIWHGKPTGQRLTVQDTV